MRNNIKFQSDFNALKKSIRADGGNSFKNWVNAECRWRAILLMNFRPELRRRPKLLCCPLRPSMSLKIKSEKRHKVNKTRVDKNYRESEFECPGEQFLGIKHSEAWNNINFVAERIINCREEDSKSAHKALQELR